MNKNAMFLISISILLLSSCGLFFNCEEGVGPVVEKEIQLEKFHEIELSGSHTVYLTQSDRQRVTVKAQENLIELLNTEVNRGEWDISFDKCVESEKEIVFYVEVPSLEAITIEGSGEVSSKSTFTSDKMELEINGSGEIQLELNTKELYTEINGSGDLKLSGTTKSHDIEINGSGDVDANDLGSDESTIEINGSGDVKVNVSYALDVEVNGSGDVYYSGNVKKINSEINGSGKLNQAE